MRTILLFLLSLFLTLPVLAQDSLYTKQKTMGSLPVLDMEAMVIDKEDNLYLLDRSRVIKMKDGKVLMEFKINQKNYTSTNPNVTYNGILADLAVDHHQNIFIINNWKQQIEKYDKLGNLLWTLPAPQNQTSLTNYSRELLVDSKNHLAIFDYLDGKIYYYSTEGVLVKTVTIPWLDNFTQPVGARVALDANDNIYYVETLNSSWDATLNFRIFNPDGVLLKEFRAEELKKQGLKGAQDMRIDKDGNIYFYSFRSPLYIVSPDGKFIKKFTPAHQSYFVYASGRVYIRFDSQNNMYLGNYYDFGSYVLKYDAAQQFVTQYGNLQRPQEVVYDKHNNLYILDNFTFKVSKWSHSGEKILEFAGKDKNIVNPLAIAVDAQDHFYMLEAGNRECIIRKYDPTGKQVNVFSIEGSLNTLNIHYTFFGLAIDHLGNMYVSSYNTHTLSKYDEQGKLLSTIGTSGKGPGQLWRPLDVTVDAAGNTYVLDMNGRRIQRFSPSGKLIQQFGSFNPNEQDLARRARISSDAFGNLVVAAGYNNYGYNSEFRVELYDIAGKLVDQMPGGTPGIAISRDGSLMAAAHKNKDIVTIYSINKPREYNFIEGNVYHDADANCLQDTGEAGMPNIIVKAEPGPYYGATDANGNYRIQVGNESYSVKPVFEEHKGKLITRTCVSENRLEGIHFENYGNYATGYNFGTSLTLSPYLSVSVSSTRRRRCFESTTTIRYTNSGFAPANNAKVYLQLPKEVELLSADKAYTRLPNGTYVFEVGTVAAGQTGIITIQDKVTCGDESVRGRTVCTRAWITPANNSTTGPVAMVTGKCNPENGMVRFVIRNTGSAPMETGQQFRVYLDGKLSTIENYKLASGDSLVLWIPTGGRTARLEADQPEGNGDNTLASATVEACKTGSAPSFSTGFVNALPPDDEEAEVAEECLPINDSFDPNDKLVTPTGRTEENYTPTGVALRYKIRFQNTGTDVAYRVVVVDTLSEYLDLSTLEMGTASHTHRFEVSGKGRPVLTWTFDNIMLPDSTTNEPGSHGYIQFSIKPKANLAEKTAVENFADIFFDYNSPVRTNITTNRIYDMPPVINEELRLDAEQIVATPGISSFSPSAGKYGTEVILTGKKFSATAISNKVYFNGVQAKVLEATATELKVLVPTASATGSIKIETPDGASRSTETFQVYQPPVISSFSPAEGVVGSTITLLGQHLHPDLVQSIKLGDLLCDIISNTGSNLVVKVPQQAGTAPFKVITKGGETLSSSAYVVWHQPSINSLSSPTDVVGATVSIAGENFASAPERNKVYFGKAQAKVVQATPDQLTVLVPKGATSGHVTVETPGGKATSALAFEVIPAPVFTAMAPAKGSVGTAVEITGTNFGTLGKQDEITFNGEKALVLEASETKYKVQVPRGATTGKIQIKGVGGVAVSTSDFVVEALTPAEAIQVYPNPTSGQLTVDLLHADFDVEAVEIYNSVGKLIYTSTVSKPRPEKLEINLDQALPGMYFIQIKTDRGVVMKKLTVL